MMKGFTCQQPDKQTGLVFWGIGKSVSLSGKLLLVYFCTCQSPRLFYPCFSAMMMDGCFLCVVAEFLLCPINYLNVIS